MAKKNINLLIMNYVKDKLSLNILNNIYEIGGYFSKNNYDELSDDIVKIKNNLPNYFYNIKNVLSKNFEDRKPFIENIQNDIETLEKLSISFIATLNFSDLLYYIIYEHSKIDLIKNSSNTHFNKESVLEEIYELLDDIEADDVLEDKGGILMSFINCNMTKYSYKDYIYKGLNMLFVNSTEKIVDCTINNLKLKFAPFEYLQNREENDFLLELFNKNLNELQQEELLNILEKLDSINKNYINKIGDISAIYNCFLDILLIYKFAIDTNYIFENDFILKDMFYYTCEMIEKNDFSMYENIEKNIDQKYEKILNKLTSNKNAIERQIHKTPYNEYSDYILTFIELNSYSILNIEDNPISKSNYKNVIATKNFIDEKIEEFINFINNLNVNNLMLKKLKQHFFFYIPCPLNIDELKAYFKNAIEGLKLETFDFVAYKFFMLANPYLLDSDLINHQCIEHLDCSHNHLI